MDKESNKFKSPSYLKSKSYYLLLSAGVELPEANLLVTMIPARMKAPPTQNSHENRSCKIISDSITAKTGVR